MCTDHNGKLVEAYLGHLERKNYSPKTVRLARYALGDFTGQLGRGVRLQDVRSEEVYRYQGSLVERDFAASSLEIFMRMVRRFFGYLEERQIIFDNPAEGLLVPRRPRPLLPAPSEEDMEKLLAQPKVETATGLRDRAAIETAYSTGMRREELFGLKVQDLDFRERTVRVLGKGRRERVLPLGKEAVGWLTRYLEHGRPRLLGNYAEHDALWVSSRGGERYGYGALQQMLRKYSRQAGITIVTPHAIRRACATHMLRRGAHPLELQMLLGHASLKTLSQYLRLSIADLKAMHEKSPPGR